MRRANTVSNRIEVLPVHANEAFPLKINVPTRWYSVNGNFRFIDAFFTVIFNNRAPTTHTAAQNRGNES